MFILLQEGRKSKSCGVFISFVLIFEDCYFFNNNCRRSGKIAPDMSTKKFLMPSSHLPRMPCDKFVYNFPCNFLGIVGGYGLRHMCSHWLRASCNFFYGASGATRVKSEQGLCGDCTKIVQCQCRCRPVSAASARKSYGAHVGIGLPVVPVRGLCNATYDMSTGYRLTIFPNLSNFSLNQIVEAAEPVNPYKNLTAASCLRREASRRPHGKGDTGRIQAP